MVILRPADPKVGPMGFEAPMPEVPHILLFAAPRPCDRGGDAVSSREVVGFVRANGPKGVLVCGHPHQLVSGAKRSLFCAKRGVQTLPLAAAAREA